MQRLFLKYVSNDRTHTGFKAGRGLCRPAFFGLPDPRPVPYRLYELPEDFDIDVFVASWSERSDH